MWPVQQPRNLPPLRYAPWGDSITYGSNAEPRLSLRWSTLVANAIRPACSYHVIEINNSYAGSDVVTYQQAHLTADVLAYNPEVIVLAGGLNDMRQVTDVPTFSAAYSAMLNAAIAHPSVRHVFCCSLAHIVAYGDYPPHDQGSDAKNHLFNAEIASLASAAGATFVDLHGGMAHNDALVDTDGIHPTTAGHANIAATVGPVVIAVLNA